MQEEPSRSENSDDLDHDLLPALGAPEVIVLRLRGNAFRLGLTSDETAPSCASDIPRGEPGHTRSRL